MANFSFLHDLYTHPSYPIHSCPSSAEIFRLMSLICQNLYAHPSHPLEYICPPSHSLEYICPPSYPLICPRSYPLESICSPSYPLESICSPYPIYYVHNSTYTICNEKQSYTRKLLHLGEECLKETARLTACQHRKTQPH